MEDVMSLSEVEELVIRSELAKHRVKEFSLTDDGPKSVNSVEYRFRNVEQGNDVELSQYSL